LQWWRESWASAMAMSFWVERPMLAPSGLMSNCRPASGPASTTSFNVDMAGILGRVCG